MAQQPLCSPFQDRHRVRLKGQAWLHPEDSSYQQLWMEGVLRSELELQRQAQERSTWPAALALCRVLLEAATGGRSTFGAEEAEPQKDARAPSRSEWDSGLSALWMESKGHRVEHRTQKRCHLAEVAYHVSPAPNPSLKVKPTLCSPQGPVPPVLQPCVLGVPVSTLPPGSV